MGCLLVMGCSPVARPATMVQQPIWSEARVLSHFQELNDPALEGRRSATVGLATAAAYVASRIAALGLQPLYVGEYRHLGYGSVNHVQAASVRQILGDSLFWTTSTSLVPGPGSQSIQATLSEFQEIGDVIPDAHGGAAAVVRGSGDRVGELAAAGFELAIVVGPGATGRPGTQSGLAVLHVSPEQWLEIQQSLPVEVAVDAEFEEQAGLVSVLGYLPGADPVARDELVIVTADLDSGGYPAGAALADSSMSGIAAAALIEAATHLTAEAAIGHGPARTVLFAWFGGAAQGDSGWQSFLDHPPWPLDAIHAVVHVGRDRPGPARRTTFVGSDRWPRNPGQEGLVLARSVHETVRRLALMPSEHDTGQ